MAPRSGCGVRKAWCALTAWLWLAAWPASAAVHVQLAAALEQLRADGVGVIYSSVLAPPDLYVDVDAVTLEALRDALPTVGLALVPRDNHWLLVSGPTVVVHASPIDAGSNEIPRVETIIVTGTRHRLSNVASDTANELSSEQLDQIPTLGGDSMRAVNLLPGMSSMGVSVKPRMRGGLDDEVLVLLDGVELLDPYHFANYQNLFSTIDSRIVDDVDVYSGGFPARYGDRMSGVIDVDTLSQADKPSAEIGVSTLSAFANARDTQGNTTWLASGRFGESDLLMERLGLQAGRPYFSDVFVRLGHAIDADTKVYGGLFSTDENIRLDDGGQKASWRNDSSYLWTRLDTTIGGRVESSTVLDYVSSRNVSRDTSPPTQPASGFLNDSRDTQRVALRSDFGVATGFGRQEFGLDVDWTRTNYDSNAAIDRGEFGVLFAGQPVSAHQIAMEKGGVSGGAYWSGDFPLTARLSVQPGLRWDTEHVQDTNAQVSPRVGLKWWPTDRLTARLDVGRFYQPQAAYEVDTADGFDELFKPQRADHYVASTTWRPTEAMQFRLDVYDKIYDRVSPRFENLFNPFQLLPQVAVDRVEIDATRARSHGVDFEWQNSLSERASVIARYSYMDADDKVEGQWVARRWSQRNTATLLFLWNSERLDASAGLTWHSGWRTSAPPAVVPIGTTLAIADVANNRSLNDYFSLDLGLSTSRPVGRSTVTIYAQLTNTLDRSNPVGIDYRDVAAPPNVTFVPDHESLLPFVASAGIVFAF